MARTQLFGRIRLALSNARAALPDAPPPGPRAISRRAMLAMMTAAAACAPREKPNRARLTRSPSSAAAQPVW